MSQHRVTRGEPLQASVESAGRRSRPGFWYSLRHDPLLLVANSRGLLAGLLVALILIGAGSHMLLENEDASFADGLWWAVVTVSTVGYGDISPKTGAGRLVAGCLIASMVLLVIPLITAQILSRLVRDADAFTHQEQEEIKNRLAVLLEQQAELSRTVQAIATATASAEGWGREEPQRPRT
jgi:voltage-gated potassium channel